MKSWDIDCSSAHKKVKNRPIFWSWINVWRADPGPVSAVITMCVENWEDLCLDYKMLIFKITKMGKWRNWGILRVSKD